MELMNYNHKRRKKKSILKKMRKLRFKRIEHKELIKSMN